VSFLAVRRRQADTGQHNLTTALKSGETMTYNVVGIDVHDLAPAPKFPPPRKRHLRAVEPLQTEAPRKWTPEDVAELRAAVEEFPHEIGSSPMLDMIIEAEGLGRQS